MTEKRTFVAGTGWLPPLRETNIVMNGICYTPDQWRQQQTLEALIRIEKLLQTLVTAKDR